MAQYAPYPDPNRPRRMFGCLVGPMCLVYILALVLATFLVAFLLTVFSLAH